MWEVLSIVVERVRSEKRHTLHKKQVSESLTSNTVLCVL